MKHNLLFLAAASFLMAAPMASISALESPNNQQPMPAGQMGQQRQISDEDLSVLLRQAVSKDQELSQIMHGVSIKVDKGVVTLSGDVNSQAEKSKIESKFKSMPGVNKVVNNIDAKEGNKDQKQNQQQPAQQPRQQQPVQR